MRALEGMIFGSLSVWGMNRHYAALDGCVMFKESAEWSQYRKFRRMAARQHSKIESPNYPDHNRGGAVYFSALL